MSNEIVPVPDEEWGGIVDQLVDQINEQDYPDKVVRATEMMLAGFPVSEVADELGTTTRTIRGWVKKYPVMAVVLANGQSLLSKWRMSKLEQQFLRAVDRSEQIMGMSMTGAYEADNGEVLFADPKIVSILASQSRFIIGLFAGQKQDITVTHDVSDKVLKAKTDALDYLSEKLLEQNDGQVIEAIETTYHVVDDKTDDGPMIGDDGGPNYGELGVLDINEEGIQCHACGNRYRALHSHLYSKHNISTKDYEVLFLLEQGAVRAAKIEE
jgi:hypothetical protein